MRICYPDSDIKPHQTFAGFVCDIPDGIIIECGSCFSEITMLDKDQDSGKPYICLQCNTEIMFPGNCSW